MSSEMIAYCLGCFGCSTGFFPWLPKSSGSEDPSNKKLHKHTAHASKRAAKTRCNLVFNRVCLPNFGRLEEQEDKYPRFTS